MVQGQTQTRATNAHRSRRGRASKSNRSASPRIDRGTGTASSKPRADWRHSVQRSGSQEVPETWKCNSPHLSPLTTPTAVAPHRLLRPQQSPSPSPRRRLAVSVGGLPGPSQPEGLEGAACLSPGAASPSFPPLAAALPGPASHRASRPGARGASVHPVSHPALWRAERPGDP